MTVIKILGWLQHVRMGVQDFPWKTAGVGEVC